MTALDRVNEMVEAWGIGAEWRARAACRGMDPRMFFPAKGDVEGIERAKAVCASCDVRSECLVFAKDNREAYGIWGRASVYERQNRLEQIQRRKAANMSANGNGSGHHASRPPWERGLREVVVADEEEIARWGDGETIPAILAVVGEFPECQVACPHLMDEAVNERPLDAGTCREHAWLLCGPCYTAHYEDENLTHSSTCITCEVPGNGQGALIVEFRDLPMFSPQGVVVAERVSSGTRTIVANLCARHGAGRLWSWPEILEASGEGT